MKQYMLLLHEDVTGLDDLSTEEIERIIGEYIAWSERLTAEDRLAGGEKLTGDGGKVLMGSGTSLRVTDGPFAESKEVIGGYFTIFAEDYDDAVKVAATCPHLSYGGKIELRAIEPTT